MLKRGLLIVLLALFTACGGGSSSDKNETTMEDLENGIDRLSDMNSSETVPDINLSDDLVNSNDLNSGMDSNISDLNISMPDLNLKRGYYVDSPVEGLEYDCDIKNGTTDSNGTFYFEEGKTCVFTLSGVVLRELNTTGLEDNVVILEDNVENARLLQVLDSDGNSDNGIQLTKNVLDELVNSGIDELPASNEDINRLFGNLEGVEGYDGALVSLEEARAHLKETIANLGLEEYLNQFPTEEEIEETTNELDSIFEGL
jgi:hypothetical protein